ncbi:MAG: hypothetical protein ACE5FQ_03025 [Thiogranum sp.]
MRASRFLLVCVWGFLGFTSSANAALLGVCTFAGGCGPDFAVTSTDPIDYTYNSGTGTGVLSFSGTVGNASFLDGQLDPSWAYGNTSLSVIPATSSGDDAFILSLTMDSSGNLLGGSLSMNGKVMAYDAGAGGIQIAPSFNGTPLDGNLIVGGAIAELGWNSSTIDFRGSIDPASLLTTAGYGTGLGGLISLNAATNTSSTGNVEWDESWTATVTGFDVVVPLPAAFWLFLSGLTALFSVSKKARAKT